MLLPNIPERDRVTRSLLAKGVEATNLYPPLTRFTIEMRDGIQARFPVARDVAERIVNLPLWPQPDGLLEKVIGALMST